MKAPLNTPMKTTTRRRFLTRAGRSTLAGLMLGLPKGWAGSVYADDSPETTTVRFGIIALTDCSSIVMAHELGLFKKYGIESTISKEASWAVIRDRLSLGENQATHLLLGIPYASTMGLQGSPVKPMVIPMYLNRNGQASCRRRLPHFSGSPQRGVDHRAANRAGHLRAHRREVLVATGGDHDGDRDLRVGRRGERGIPTVGLDILRIGPVLGGTGLGRDLQVRPLTGTRRVGFRRDHQVAQDGRVRG